MVEDIRFVANQANPSTVFGDFCERYQVTENEDQRALKELFNDFTPGRSLKLEERDASNPQEVIRTVGVSLRWSK